MQLFTMRHSKMVLIDSRTQPEYAESHIVAAVKIPEKIFKDKPALLTDWKAAGFAVEK